VNGRIAAPTLSIRGDRQWATFSLRGQQAQIEVSCPGPLPDNLAEEMDVVVEGPLERGDVLRVRGEKVLTRCASKYQAQQDGN
jgi:cytochrome c-type biogenesis protein CcmE